MLEECSRPVFYYFYSSYVKKNGIKMIREIELNNRTVKYDLQYKRVKNINLRIKPDGSISVSAHKRISQTIIDDFLISKSDFILRALDKCENKQAKEQKQYFAEDEVKNKIYGSVKMYIRITKKKEYNILK